MNFNKIINKVKTQFSTVSKNEILNKVDEYLFAFVYISYAYFKNEEDKFDDIEKSLIYDRRSTYIDSIIYDDIFYDESIIFYHFIYDPSRTKIEPNEVAHIIEKIDKIINDIERQNFSDVGESLYDAFKLAENESGGEQNKQIRIVTNFDANSEEKTKVNKSIKDLLKDKKITTEWVVLYSDDISDFIEDVDNPTQTIEEDYLTIDVEGNYIKHTGSKTSYIFNITGKSLQKLYNTHSYRLFGLNLRHYIKNNEVDNSLKETLNEQPHNFWYLNNGIILIADKVLIEKKQVKLKNFSIINGGQTTYVIGTSEIDEKVLLTCKVIVSSVLDSSKEDFIGLISKATNSQKQIQPKDLVANRKEQIEIKKNLSELEILLEIKRGERRKVYTRKWLSISNDKLAQTLLSFVYQKPGAARSQKKLLFLDSKTRGYYDTLFVQNKYDTNFLKDLILLQNYYSKGFLSKKNLEKDNPMIKDLKLNSQLMVLAVLGLFVKLQNNKVSLNSSIQDKDFINDINKSFFKNYPTFKEDLERLFGIAIRIISVSLSKCNLSNKKKELSPTNFTKNDTYYKNYVIDEVLNNYKSDPTTATLLNKLINRI
jgi:hypothetical protein